MLHSQNIICISSIDWDFNWQGHQEIMATFAKNNNRVLFIENTGIRPPTLKDLPRLKKRFNNWHKGINGIRKEKENLFILSPLVIPFPYLKIARWINRFFLLSTLKKWMKVMDFNDPIIWTFLPTGISLDLIDRIDNKISIYYCIAKFAKLVKNSQKVKKTERELLKKVDVVFVQGQDLKELCEKYSRNVTIFPFGVKPEIFHNAALTKKENSFDLKGIKKPIIGYVGGLHRHIDYELIEKLAESNPDWSFLFVGPIQTDVSKIKRFDNVFLIGEKKHLELPKYIGAFDVCLIPYLLNDYTSTVYPTKLNEYLIMGKPVISTELPEVRNFNQKYGDVVMIGQDANEFNNFITDTLKNVDRGAIDKRIRAALDNSWQKRIEQMSDLIEEAIERRKQDKDLGWKENLYKFYRKTRRRFVIIGIVFLLLYLLIFQTPLLWLAARPLKISQSPRPANAIVVFAGGVGESGQAGQGHQERVVHSVNLYKKNYAQKLIFSSGYTYVMQEADVMKALAVSLGVPGEDIILEKNAGSTYQNVKFTTAIMEKHGWNSALVVSSSYHMRRVALVYDKVAPELNINLSPVPTSGFYGNEKKVKLRHIKGIMHEYLGIIYYWLKGYI